jgi:hypothetical protein
LRPQETAAAGLEYFHAQKPDFLLWFKSAMMLAGSHEYIGLDNIRLTLIYQLQQNMPA